MPGGTAIRWMVGLLLLVGLAGLGWWLAPEPEAPPASAGHRIVSLSPSVTESLFAIGAGAKVVGRSAFDVTPSEVVHLPAVGTALTPDLEAIARLRPSHIFTEATQAGPVDQLRALAPVTVLPWLTVEDAASSIRRMGRITGHDATAERRAAALEAAFAGSPGHDAPRAIALLGVDDLQKGEVWFIKRNSIHGRALEAAGLRNAVDGDVPGAPTLSLEELIRLDPDVILVLLPDDALTPDQRQRVLDAFQGLPRLSAVRAGAVEVVHGPEVVGTGPSVADLVGQLRAASARALGQAAAP